MDDDVSGGARPHARRGRPRCGGRHPSCRVPPQRSRAPPRAPSCPPPFARRAGGFKKGARHRGGPSLNSLPVPCMLVLSFSLLVGEEEASRLAGAG